MFDDAGDHDDGDGGGADEDGMRMANRHTHTQRRILDADFIGHINLLLPPCLAIETRVLVGVCLCA